MDYSTEILKWRGLEIGVRSFKIAGLTARLPEGQKAEIDGLRLLPAQA